MTGSPSDGHAILVALNGEIAAETDGIGALRDRIGAIEDETAQLKAAGRWNLPSVPEMDGFIVGCVSILGLAKIISWVIHR